MTAFHHSVVQALILAAALAAGSPAAGQSSQPSRATADIQARFQRSATLQQQALESLTDPGRAERLIRTAYIELRGALSTMEINASGAKFPDPLLGINAKRAGQALSLLQAAGDALKTNQPGVEAPAAVRTNLEQAMRLTNGIVVY